MKLVIQRVSSAEVLVDKKLYGKIQKGIVIFLGIAKKDSEKDVKYLVDLIDSHDGKSVHFTPSLLKEFLVFMIILKRL